MHDDAFPWVTLLYLEYKRVILSSKASFVDTRCVQACAVGNARCPLRAASARHVSRRSESLSCRELSVLWLLPWRLAGQPCWLTFRVVNCRVVTSMMTSLPQASAPSAPVSFVLKG